MEDHRFDEDKLVELISVQGEMEAKIIFGILQSEGITVLVKSNMASGALPFTADGMGEVKLLVLEEDLTRAKVVIKEYLKRP